MGRWSSPSDYDASEAMGDPVPRQVRSQPRAQSGVPIAKPELRKKTKARKDRLDAKKLSEFRLAVWVREQTREFLAAGSMIARCQQCRARVWYDSNPHGEVHHRIGRRAKATRYDPANGVLLCPSCHGKAQRHEITV